MLIKFEVERFKNFKNKIIFDLSNTNGYTFNNDLLEDGVIRGGVIFGKNASGKSNLGLAIFDIITHLTDKEKGGRLHPYINLDAGENNVEFKYTFKFNGCLLEYMYKKSSPENLLSEKLLINKKEVIAYDYEKNDGQTSLKGAESLNVDKKNLNVDQNGATLSFVKYINNNTVLKEDPINAVFKKFIKFVDNMLLFYSLDSNYYRGYAIGNESIENSIVKKGKLEDFEKFLNSLDISCKLKAIESDGQHKINYVYQNGEASFFGASSTGTRALAVYYYWLINAENASLIFMDEFDAYYHFELSAQIVRETLKRRKKAQILFTSHNTSLMTNDLFRPDCLFILQDTGLKSMSQLTNKELRCAHNLQKMYRAGAFNE